MKKIAWYSAIASAVVLLTACGGGVGESAKVALPVGLWAGQAEGARVRQLYVLPPLVAGARSEAWAIESEVVGGVTAPRLMVFGELEAGATTLTGAGSLQDLSVEPSTNTSINLVVTPSAASDSLTLSTSGVSWALTPLSFSVAGEDSQLWSGNFVSTAAANFLSIDWSFSMSGASGTLSASDTVGCTYEGTLASVGDSRLPNVVRLSFSSTNIPPRQECGDWSGMGTVSRQEDGTPVARTLWLRQLNGDLLQQVSATPSP